MPAETVPRATSGGASSTENCDSSVVFEGVNGGVTESAVRAALAGVQDPELPIGILDLGLVYAVRIADGEVHVDLTHTAMGCPAIDMMQEDVEAALLRLPGVERVRVTTVWDPPWTKARLTPRGRAALLACGISL